MFLSKRSKAKFGWSNRTVPWNRWPFWNPKQTTRKGVYHTGWGSCWVSWCPGRAQGNVPYQSKLHSSGAPEGEADDQDHGLETRSPIGNFQVRTYMTAEGRCDSWQELLSSAVMWSSGNGTLMLASLYQFSTEIWHKPRPIFVGANLAFAHNGAQSQGLHLQFGIMLYL